MGLQQLSTLLFDDEQTVREAEPLLIRLDLIELTNGGRAITRAGKAYLQALEQV
jgi:Holliday junction resolvasome RuvABC ATP-dependent DNA helicase subunit